MNAVVNRIRTAINAGVGVEDIHDAILASNPTMSEGDFFLCYRAAEILARYDAQR